MIFLNLSFPTRPPLFSLWVVYTLVWRYEQHCIEEKTGSPKEDTGLFDERRDIRDLERMAIHWRCVWQDGEVDADLGYAHADDAIVQRIPEGREGRDGVGGMSEDYSQSTQHAGGEAQVLLQLLELLLLLCVHHISEEALQANQWTEAVLVGHTTSRKRHGGCEHPSRHHKKSTR